ncbi:hypothetical protein COS55_01735 [Candidatus Shapirobacteria bacterium CG03_land_8_20_14_0_80_40_19]|uniref:Uncharacterized protein n=3 Tax=Candidatus Shapironibacteriota TaxID=1752721 RepID=A0A2M7BEB4_9BACT|nr:MAG: hypothetical protein COV89_03420 [Candidatus Shapirobacteria bacterium CG11_big_fil_rev_8_21_14_0_20_40_12]PIV01472.1 MAG: hypothetical protein COS55_01735 [Candidatus Shapirobacteria bacterium CG03_land_8_20_14_0_80_40_19]PJC29056.1 MAG: hypothetical protein CO053_01340 [Candidatus Shapirobacteria bacterium CG_4_9_14_0_2_um_filter_40_11]
MLVILVIAAGAAGFFWTKNNWQSKILGEKDKVDSTDQVQPTIKPAPNFPTIIGNFLVTDKEVCLENDKPIVYFFGSSSCPHCVWEKPIVQKVFGEFKNEISYHENFDNGADSEVFNQYSDINPGYVPFLVLGCKYARVGAGEQLGATDEESQKLEKEALTSILCKLTDGKPENICRQVKDKMEEIK